MEGKTIYIVMLYIVLMTNMAETAIWSQKRDEYLKLHSAYEVSGTEFFYSDILPRSNDNNPIDVTLEMEMFFLREFDALNGALEIVGSLSMTWVDPIETLSTTTTFDTSAVESVLINYKKIWTPVIVLLNSADSIQRVGDETYLARFNLSTGVVTLKPRVLMKASCTPSVTYFPFDQHECDFIFVPWYQDSTKVRLQTVPGEWKLTKYKDSGIWRTVKTSSTVTLSNGYYFAKFTITFVREPLFFAINVVFPVLLLSVLSGFLFLLPVASGERVGFAIMCFLSFIVLLQVMVQFLPEISDPMSLLCIYSVIMMIFSGVLSIANIVLIRVYNKAESDDMPKVLLHVLEVIRCVKCKRLRASNRNTSNGKEKAGSDVEALSPGSELRSETSETSVTEKHVDWISVGKLLDTFFIILFIAAQIGFTLVFLAPIVSQA